MYQTDYDLVDRYLNGDTKAGELLFAEAYPMLKKYVFKKTNTTEMLEEDKMDIVQDTLKKSIEKLSYYDGSSKFTTYIIGIAERKIKESIRIKTKRNIKELSMDEEPDILEIPDNLFGKDPLHIIIDAELRKALEEAIVRLTSNYQTVICLKSNGMKTKQIAELSGQSEETVQSMYCRALKELRKNFKKIY